jgi:hypothetical protein
VDASSRVDSLTTGTVRHLFFAGEGGTSFEFSDRVRVDLIAELGVHRLSGSRSGPFHLGEGDAGTDVWLGSDPAWAPFVGARPSMELLFTQMAVGVGGWARADLVALNPTAFLDPAAFPAYAPRTSLGRFSAGMDVHLAVRFQ